MNVQHKGSFNCAGLCAVAASAIFNVCFNYLGKLLLISLHQLYTWYYVIGARLHYLSHVKKLMRTMFKTVHLDIKSRVSTYEKVPNHLTIIIGVESPSYADFAKLIGWCVQSGISHISFYDHYNGIDCKLLFVSVCEDAKQYIPFIKWGKSFSEDFKEMSKSQINGYSWKPILTVHVYQRNDGINMFFKSVPDLINSGIDTLDIKQLDTFLRKYVKAPDPDFALICGDVFSSFGFPPWCLRVTQFKQITTHHNLTVEAFLEQLEEYSTCKQRWGK